MIVSSSENIEQHITALRSSIPHLIKWLVVERGMLCCRARAQNRLFVKPLCDDRIGIANDGDNVHVPLCESNPLSSILFSKEERGRGEEMELERGLLE
ncbi:unnamed protein product [Toxocara canis]|uniref:Uncharacterized protein n=1 Tax=Toxocara canis TaxID=6265 RepID=A0A183VEV0_TOXCA|nr:unnamed protein product [Toxocara canis]